jgi:hypothetical protein
MESLAAFGVIVFLLGLSIGLLYRQAHRRRLTRLEEQRTNPDKAKTSAAPLDKPPSHG